MPARVLTRHFERIRRYLERGRAVLVRTRARRKAPLDEETLLEHYESLAYALRAVRWRSRGRFARRGEALVELRADAE